VLLRSLIRLGLALGGLGAAAGPLAAAEVRGAIPVDPVPVDPKSVPVVPGYVSLRVAQPAPAQQSRVRDYAVFLQVEDSLPLPAPTETPTVRIRGFELSPRIVSCPVDAPVTVVNESRRAFEVEVGGRSLATLAPGERADWVCAAGAEGAVIEPITVVGHPFMRASVYVGEVGIAATPDAAGRFALEAPAGTYRLWVIGEDGVESDRPVEVAGRDVDLGRLGPAEGAP
jgi:hypothetical protein